MITIYHNPECGTSRNVLQIIRDAGYSPQGLSERRGRSQASVFYILRAQNENIRLSFQRRLDLAERRWRFEAPKRVPSTF